MKKNWNKLDAIPSKGSQTEKAPSLGALHATRLQTLSQYWTPPWLVSFIWKSIEHAFTDDAQKYSLFDSSVGAASMFRFADPDRFHLRGFDVDAEVIVKTAGHLDELGFTSDIVQASLAEVKLKRSSVSLLNPPFSIQLESAAMEAYPGVTHYGKNGKDTSALSDEYAVAQALKYSQLVCAVVPKRVTKLFRRIEPRLVGIYHLPASTFSDETVDNVAVDLLVFAKSPSEALIERKISEKDAPNGELAFLSCKPTGLVSQPIKVHGVTIGENVIKTRLSDDKRVLMSAENRKIKLTFFDGATEAKVLNRIYEQRLESTHKHKIPKNVKYSGQFKLYLDVLVMQDDPWSALNQVCSIIDEAGGIAIITPQLEKALHNLIIEHEKMSIPFGRTVYRKGAPKLTGVASKTGLINRHQPGAVLQMGEEVTAERTKDGFALTTKRGVFECPHDTLFSLVSISEDVSDDGYWEVVEPPISDTYPEEIEALRKKAESLGLIEWLTWYKFQVQDLLEVAFRPKGAIVGWQMALGKTRLALALALLLEGNTLIALKSRLVPEMCNELAKLGVDPSLYKVINGPSDTVELRKINILSYDRNKASSRNSDRPDELIADLLRGRITNVVADEGGLMSKEESHQTKAMHRLGTEKNYIFDGTPMPNYCRECLPLAEWVMGSEVSYQPYSTRGAYLTPELFQVGSLVRSGREVFISHFSYVDWSTNEWDETGRGAKREIPKIRTENLGLFRSWLAPIIKRRVQSEPDVAYHVVFPVPTIHEPFEVPWNDEHLRLYIRAVMDFKSWYERYAEAQKEDKKSINLTVILQNLEACFKAANAPHMVSGFAEPYLQETSKQVAVIDHVEKLVNEGRRPIVFARTPSVINRLTEMAADRGITGLAFTGEKTIKQRTKELDEKVRKGNVHSMFAGLGVTSDGLKAQFDTFIFYNRDFKAITEFQAMFRLLRAEQQNEVHGYFYHYCGSIDIYMSQLVEWKALAAESGLDYGEQPDEDEFLHFDTFFHRFINSTEELQMMLNQRHESPQAISAFG